LPENQLARTSKACRRSLKKWSSRPRLPIFQNSNKIWQHQRNCKSIHTRIATWW